VPIDEKAQPAAAGLTREAAETVDDLHSALFRAASIRAGAALFAPDAAIAHALPATAGALFTAGEYVSRHDRQAAVRALMTGSRPCVSSRTGGSLIRHAGSHSPVTRNRGCSPSAYCVLGIA
jgi:hypothetical protein